MQERPSPDGHIYSFALHRGLEVRDGDFAFSYRPVTPDLLLLMSEDELRFVHVLVQEALERIFGAHR